MDFRAAIFVRSTRFRFLPGPECGYWLPMPLLASLFALTALLYAAVGFGGGSTYNALLVLNGTDYRILPAIA